MKPSYHAKSNELKINLYSIKTDLRLITKSGFIITMARILYMYITKSITNT